MASSQSTTPPLTFFFRTKEIRQHPNQIPEPRVGPHFYWEPPHRTTHCQADPWTPWFSWPPGDEAVALNTAAITLYSTRSMFWCSDRQSFVHVPYDCTVVEVEEQERLLQGWERFTFNHFQHSDQPLSLLRYQGQHVNYELATKAPARMINSLIPIAYQPDQLGQPPSSCAIAGDLATIVGLVAFTTQPGRLPAAMTNWFRRGNDPRWNPPPGNYERPWKRGLVVSIGYYSNSATNPSNTIRDWENGVYGAIVS